MEAPKSKKPVRQLPAEGGRTELSVEQMQEALAAEKERGQTWIGRLIAPYVARIKALLREWSPEPEGSMNITGKGGGKAAPTTEQLFKKFMSTSDGHGGSRETSLGMRAQFLAQIMITAPAELRLYHNNPTEMSKIQAVLEGVEGHPAFGATVQLLAAGKKSDSAGMSAGGQLFGGGGGMAAESRLKGQFGSLKATAAMRIARAGGEQLGVKDGGNASDAMVAEVKGYSYGLAPGSVAKKKASGTLGAWRPPKPSK